MFLHGFPKISLDFFGSPMIFIGFHKISNTFLLSMDAISRGFRLISKHFNWFLWISYAFIFCADLHGFLWISTDFENTFQTSLYKQINKTYIIDISLASATAAWCIFALWMCRDFQEFIRVAPCSNLLVSLRPSHCGLQCTPLLSGTARADWPEGGRPTPSSRRAPQVLPLGS